MPENDKIIYAEGREIDRMMIAYLTLKTIMDIGINVRVLTNSEFEHEFMKDPIAANLMERLPDAVKPSKVAYGSAAQKPPSINFENILQGIIQFKNNEGVVLNLGQITLVAVLFAIHEYGHSKLGYRHCDKAMCLMKNGLPLSKLEDKLVFHLEPCEEHEKMKILLSRPEIQGLI